MPCRDPFPYDLPEPREHTQQKPSSSYQRTKNLELYGVEATDEELPGILMEYACQAFQELERATKAVFPGPFVSKLPGDVADWWSNHKVRDVKRLEKVRENALAKLSVEEQEVLRAFFGAQK